MSAPPSPAPVPSGSFLGPTERRALARAGTVRTASEGDVLFRTGERDATMYLIEEGRIELRFGEGKDGKVLGEWDFFGELALLTGGRPRTGTAVALTDARLHVLDPSALETLRRENPALLCSLLQEACAYLVASEGGMIADLQARNRELERTLDYLRRTREELDATEILANTDALTGLYNRRCLDLQLPKFIARGNDSGLGVSLVLIDLDHLKPINDTHGHAAGDEAIRQLGALIRRSVRASDLPVRLGGDEFAVVLVDLAEAAARSWAERFVRAVPASVTAPGVTALLSASLGGAALVPGESPDELMRRADESLYAAKEAGRNRLAWLGRA